MSGARAHSSAQIGPVGRLDSPVHRLDPRAKLVGMVAIVVVAVATPVELWPVYAACAAVLAAVIAIGRIPVLVVLRRAALVLPFVLLVALLLPFVRDGGTSYEVGPLTAHQAGLVVLAGVAAKSAIGVIAMVVLGATTEFPAALRGLEAMRVPRLLTLIAAFAYRYAFVIAGEVRRMRQALVSRGFKPRHALQAGATGRVAAALFLRSYARGERVHQAMLARGFSGSMPQMVPLRFGAAELAFVAAVCLAVIPLRIALGVAA